MITKTLTLVNEYLDVKMGFLGALFMASWVFWINYDHGMIDAGIAASKQGLYTLFFGGLFLRMAENIATTRKKRVWSILCGGAIPMLITSALTFGLHNMKGTPEPFHSTLPTVVFSYISFTTWAWFKTRRSEG